MSSYATIGEFTCLASSTVKWSLTGGVNPFETTVDLQPADADSLLAQGLRPTTLTIGDGNGKEVIVKGIYALSRSQTEEEHIAKVLIVDRRWFWRHAHITRHFNMLRVAGSKRHRSPDSPLELHPLSAKVMYAPFSLKNGELWTATEALENVLAHCLRPEGEATAAGAGYNIDQTIGSRLDNLPLIDVELDDPADQALRRILSYLPEAQVYVDLDGVVQVYSLASGKEETEVLESGPEAFAAGHVSWIVNANIRPREIHVLFTREHEIRFDFEESSSPTATEDQRYCENVLPIPDFSLRMKTGETLSQGNWKPLVDVVEAWGAPPIQTQLSTAAAWLKFLRLATIPHADMWNKVGLAGKFDPSADWMSRLGALQGHYRRTYRINPRWMGRILQLKANLTTTLDPVTGTRAPALAWFDYCRMGSERSFYRDIGDEEGPWYNMNVKSHPGPPSTATFTSDRPAAPARVSIPDHDQGILHVDLLGDIYRMREVLIPGMIALEGATTTADGRPTQPGPTSNINDVYKCIAYNSISKQHRRPILSTPFFASFLLTAIPAGSNSQLSEQFQRVKVKPGDVSDMLPSGQNRIEPANGPIMEIRVNATIETARVAWLDSEADHIEASFGLSTWGSANIDHLISNLDGDAAGGGSLTAIAHAVAARTWAMMTDRYIGQKSVGLRPETKMTGSIATLSHELEPSGAAMTTLELPAQLKAIDIFSRLPDSTRRIILRQAPSPGKGLS